MQSTDKILRYMWVVKKGLTYMWFESLKRREGECDKQSIKEIITNNFSILKKNCKHKFRMSYEPKAGKYKRKKERKPHWVSSA